MADVCAICFDSVQGAHAVLPCSHPYCAVCLATWLPIQRTCPYCRGPVEDIRAIDTAGVDPSVLTYLDSGWRTKNAPEELDRCFLEPPGNARQVALIRFMRKQCGLPLTVLQPNRVSEAVRQCYVEFFSLLGDRRLGEDIGQALLTISCALPEWKLASNVKRQTGAYWAGVATRNVHILRPALEAMINHTRASGFPVDGALLLENVDDMTRHESFWNSLDALIAVCRQVEAENSLTAWAFGHVRDVAALVVGWADDWFVRG